ncbi:protein FAR1-RELATED SEQUENCE 5-like [Spinacia oleracea]|uniref:Protein FAR1-RELATED SEQUENCE 5-like n=1 Tax=Spinacia oleracea TaxID=3562 RepID=A0ABM3RP76_SPIOL|nr:protein FAR1-RELATED SEQUENCE 5-like [Spinacia oleracea]
MDRLRFKCKKGGVKKSEGSNVTGCKMFVYGRVKNGEFVLVSCDLKHNHPLSPDCSRMMVNYRSIDGPTFDRIMINERAGVNISRNFGTQLIEKGGFDNMTFNKKDVRNAIAVERRKTMFEKGDVAGLEEYCMPFAPFVGVNHHGKSIVFAAALISHEDTESFIWVFEEWLKCTGKPPKGKLAEWKSIDTLIRTAVHDMLDPNEFDEVWCLVMDKYNQRGKGWMQDAYDNRRQWAPAYNRGTFWAGMSSTQRSEGMNRYFKIHVNLKCGLVQFIKNYEFCMNIKVEEEKEDNFDSVDTPPQLDVDKSVLAEYVFHKVYTNAMFADVVHERKGLTHTNVTRTDSLEPLVLYRADEKLTSPHWRKRYKSYNVKVDKVKGELSCSCQLWRKQVRSYESIRVSYYDPEESKRLAKAKELTQRHNYLRELAMHNEEAYKLYTEATDALRIKMEDVVGIRKTGNVGDNSICWWDPDARNVFGRRRLCPREHNERALKRVAQPPEEGVIKTPVDKRHELIRSTYGHIPSYRDRQEHANNVHDARVNLSYNGPVLEDIPESSQINLSEDLSQTFDYDAFVWRKRPGGRMTL